MHELDEFWEAFLNDNKELVSKAFGTKVADLATASDPEAGECLCVVTSRTGPSPFTDNLHGDCALCGEEVMFRPHSPKLRKVCTECWFSLGPDEVERRLTVN